MLHLFVREYTSQESSTPGVVHIEHGCPAVLDHQLQHIYSHWPACMCLGKQTSSSQGKAHGKASLTASAPAGSSQHGQLLQEFESELATQVRIDNLCCAEQLLLSLAETRGCLNPLDARVVLWVVGKVQTCQH
jgi:hypothetical protein